MPSFKKPEIGKYVQVVLDWSKPMRGYAVYLSREFHVEGIVIEDFPWQEADSFVIATPNKLHPKSVIPLAYVSELKFKDNTVAETVDDTKTKFKVFSIAGSKGNTYSVTQNGTTFTCDCVAGQFGRDCKHVREVKASLV